MLGKYLLRRKGIPYKTKNYQENRGKFPVSNSIEMRPIEANNRTRLGDWEIDTVLGKQGGACLLTVVCRKSRFSFAYISQKLSFDFVKTSFSFSEET